MHKYTELGLFISAFDISFVLLKKKEVEPLELRRYRFASLTFSLHPLKSEMSV